MFVSWPCPMPDGTVGDESALTFDHGRAARLLVLPPLFEEANKTRHQLVEIMRRLDLAGADSILPDLPGCNESLARQDAQSLGHWRAAAAAAAAHFGATHVFAVRSGAWFAPQALPGWLHAPARPGSVLRAMLRARTIAANEAGHFESADGIMLQAREVGTVLAGWDLGPQLICELEDGVFMASPLHRVIEQPEVGGPALWLRAEPDDDPEQADVLATILAVGMMGE